MTTARSSNRSRAASVALLCLAVLGGLVAVVVTTSAPASARNTCYVQDADLGFGTRESCTLARTAKKMRVSGKSSWYFDDDGQAANTGTLAGRVTKLGAGPKCVYAWIGSEFGGFFSKGACRQGEEVGFNVQLGEDTGPQKDAGHHYYLFMCNGRNRADCTRVWKQSIGENAPS